VIFRIERNFSQRWMEASPFSRRLDIASFSARWSGRFMAPLSGQYRWGIMTGEWARIFIDNKLIAGNWGDPSAGGGFDISREVIRECTLEAGCSYEILIEYTRSPQPQSNVRSLRLGCRLPVSPDLVDRAVRLAARSDVALVFAGLNDEWESEGFDRENMDLPPAQTDLICKIAAANPHTVVVLNNGSPLSMSEWIDKVPAVVEAWFPGQECGNAVADILSGDVNPSGKLPDTFPRRIEDNPAYPFYPGSDGKVIYGED
jgi:beta-glucosidase